MLRPLLILDLDETLIYGTEAPLDRSPDFETDVFSIYQRPHLRTFLDQITPSFELAVWSAASSTYVEAVVRRIFDGRSLAFAWAVDRCTSKRDVEMDTFYWVKDLAKVKRRGFDLARVLVVDDTPRKAERNYGNAVYVAPFVGDPSDAELPALARYLLSIRDRPDYRTFEKRGWHTRA
jgi:RNA polymerase II subunit A small phosphatase-like protein